MQIALICSVMVQPDGISLLEIGSEPPRAKIRKKDNGQNTSFRYLGNLLRKSEQGREVA